MPWWLAAAFGSFEQYGTSIKTRPIPTLLKTALVLFAALGVWFSISFISAYAAKIANGNPEKTSTTFNGSFAGNYASDNSGSVNQTFIALRTQPHIDATTTSPSQLESDGFYHTTYQLTLWDGSQTVAPQTFHISDFFVKCLPTKHIGLQLQPSTALVNTIECLSKKIPPTNEVLFQF